MHIKNYNEISPHTSQNGHLQNVYTPTWSYYGGKRTLLHYWWDVSSCNYYGKQSGGSMNYCK